MNGNKVYLRVAVPTHILSFLKRVWKLTNEELEKQSFAKF